MDTRDIQQFPQQGKKQVMLLWVINIQIIPEHVLNRRWMRMRRIARISSAVNL
ncbi:hypothetical protein M422DRAFT_33858 [Sphaerobolus stellatus SS14]|uniref:Uncharacterized protein n=1 Tax=Sphaerobolus stellatus (strain SS14) TaxID=990650 RepID=A0A0C9VIG8_SPHS4|nr:hypothetical protein M422DRAFT_33858 [Sphaerobolus stellatus SS14]